MKTLYRSLNALALSFALLLIACGGEDFSQTAWQPDDSDTNGDTDTLSNILGIGDPCETSGDCAVEGIVCSSVDNTCQLPGSDGTRPEDSPCVSSLDCAAGLVCAADTTCQPIGDPGTTQQGESCATDTDCVFGLLCIEDICDGVPFVPWDGAGCEELPETPPDTFEIYFDVNRESGEFYRLPFPNDAAMTNGKIDLAGHTNPGTLIPELGNPIDSYFEYIENELDGFGTSSYIFIRFNRAPDWDTVDLMNNVYIVNIDTDSPQYGEKIPTGYAGNIAAGMYICNNWIALRPAVGKPLAPGTTYAALITTDLHDRDGNALERSIEFNTMFATGAPSGDKMLAAWNAYAPLRSFVGDVSQGVDPATIAGGTVFTTQTNPQRIVGVREAVRNEPAPILVDNQISTDTSNGAFIRYTGSVTVPFYQEGDRPFKTEGGGVSFNGSGQPVRVEDEAVPFVATVPQGSAPVDGWPVMLYAHGTGGTENSAVDTGVAETLAGMGVATITLLQVQHGERRGPVDGAMEASGEYDPGTLFYNFANPYAAVGNNIQASADYFQLVRLLEDFATITGESVLFDTARFYFFGHSQGTQGQFIAAAHEPLIQGIVLSGAGGYLIESLLGKKEPIDVAAGMQVVLMDPNVTATHPILNLIQMSMEQVDPPNHRLAVWRNGWEGMDYPNRDVFMSVGIGDTYAPDATQLALVKSLGLDIDVIPGHEPTGGYTEITAYPYINAHTYANGPINTVAVEYEPDGDYNGHFVIFRHAQALGQWPHFVETMVAEDGNSPELISGL